MDTVQEANAVGGLLLADSFRVSVRDGAPSVRGLDRHLARFTASVIRLGVGTEERLAFVGRAREEIAAFGEGFPRIELRAAPGSTGAGSPHGEFSLQLRELPELDELIELRTVPFEPDPLAMLKGPMIATYRELNRRAGAEALLCDVNGNAREGATTTLLAWDGDVLVRSSSLRRVISVTEALVSKIAAEQRRPVVAAPLTPELLRRAELWAVNALHGIRVVRVLDGEDRPPAEPERLAAFRAELDETWEPVRIHSVQRK